MTCSFRDKLQQVMGKSRNGELIKGQFNQFKLIIIFKGSTNLHRTIGSEMFDTGLSVEFPAVLNYVD